jgi:hypothetical protein
MSLRADHYRRRGIEAQQRAADATDLNIRQAFQDIARDWFVLAEQVTKLEEHQDAAMRESEKK